MTEVDRTCLKLNSRISKIASNLRSHSITSGKKREIRIANFSMFWLILNCMQKVSENLLSDVNFGILPPDDVLSTRCTLTDCEGNTQPYGKIVPSHVFEIRSRWQDSPWELRYTRTAEEQIKSHRFLKINLESRLVLSRRHKKISLHTDSVYLSAE